MKKVTVVFLGIALVFNFFQCGGPKTLTPEEYAQLSPQERVVYLERHIEKTPENIELKKKLYGEYLNLGMTDRAIVVMRDIITQDPYQADVQFEYGKLMMERGEYNLAYRSFKETLGAPGGSAYLQEIAQYLGGSYSIQQLTTAEADEAFPCFSPDGSKIVYQINQNGSWDIAEMDLASGEVTYLLDSPADEELPSYSPDGKKLVFTSNVDDRRPIDNKFKVREIYSFEIETGYIDNLTETVADDWLPRFNHKGDLVVFVSERSDLRQVPYTEKHSDIYLMESDGDFHLRLTETESNEGGACFSMDDKHIFFHSNRNGTYDIFIMKSDGSMPMTIIGDSEANEVNPFVDPDSQHIVYFSDKSGNYDIYRATVNGGQIERLTFSPAKDTNPVVSPDGKFIAFHSDRTGNYDIFLLNLEVSTELSVADIQARLDQLISQ
ncbi:MAG: hypothetical protein Kow0042_17130 [Calditrichia bacterium]